MALFRKRVADRAQREPVRATAPPPTNATPPTAPQPTSATEPTTPDHPAPAPVSSAPEPEGPVDPEMALAAKRAQLYGAACGDVLNAANACLAVANAAVGARNMAAKRPQHDISIKHFVNMADSKDQEFSPLYRDYVAACSTAKKAAENLLQSRTSHDPELVLLIAIADESYTNASTARHLIAADMGSTPATFLEGLQRANAAIQAEVVGYGEEGFQGRIYRPPLPEQNAERTCPWCAETIKAAAVICRFCGRDLTTSPNTLSN